MREKPIAKVTKLAIIAFTGIFFFVVSMQGHRVRAASLPFISGDSFRSLCNFVIDESTVEQAPSIIPFLMQEADTIFVKNEYLNTHFTITHPAIKAPYVLITHNSDLDSPGDYYHYLDDPKIIAWFAMNADRIHPKLVPIPIGVISDCNYFGCRGIGILEQMVEKKGTITKDVLLLLNITIGTYVQERQYVYNMFASQPYCTVLYNNNPEDYLTTLARSKFVLSPRGTGQDCHRTWEAVLMGCIPIVTNSSLNSLYEGLPILVIDDWNQINEEFLDEKYQEIKSKTYNYERLCFTYWSRLITKVRRDHFASR